MVTKYKLIKEYPGSPELGTIVPLIDQEYIRFRRKGPVEKYSRIYKYILPKYSEFWEEVNPLDEILEECKKKYPVGTRIKDANNPKEIKIVSKKSSSGDWLIDGIYYFDHSKKIGVLAINESGYGTWLYYDGKWAEIIEETKYKILSFKQIKGLDDEWLPDWRFGWSRNGGDTLPLSTHEILNNPNYQIYSIKRLSDNEVFTLGDAVQLKMSSNSYWAYTNCILDKIVLKETKKDVDFKINQEGNKSMYYQGIEFWRKAPKQIKPLFKTEDGVNKCLGDYCYFIASSNCKVGYGKVTESAFKEALARFDSRENAEKWIEKNVPEYEILTLRYITKSKTYNKDSYCYKDVDGRYKYSNRMGYEYAGSSLEGCLSNGWEIYEVKRTSDGEKFKLGDLVEHIRDSKDTGKIIRFYKNTEPGEDNMCADFEGPNYRTDNTDKFKYSNGLRVLKHSTPFTVREESNPDNLIESLKSLIHQQNIYTLKLLTLLEKERNDDKT